MTNLSTIIGKRRQLPQEAFDTDDGDDRRLEEGVVVPPPLLERNICTQPPGAVAMFPGGIGVRRRSTGGSGTPSSSHIGIDEEFLDWDEAEHGVMHDDQGSEQHSSTVDMEIFKAELAGGTPGGDNDDNANHDVLVIEGVKTSDPSVSRRLCLFVGVLFLASAIAVAAGMIATRILGSNDRANNSTVLSNQTLDRPPHVVPTVVVSGNFNQTIGGNLSEGSDSVDIFFAGGSRDIFQTMLNRTDTTFTMIGVVRGAALFFPWTDISIISKLVLPLWAGHVLDAIQAYVVEGRGLAPEELYDGLVLTSVSGYPLYFQMDPFRVNNHTMATTGHDAFKNGVVYRSFTTPNPLAPWIGKSLFDVLVETNSVLNGDLSKFIALIEASPQIKEKIELQKGSTKATTLFAPTNNALLTTLDADQMSLVVTNTTLRQLFLLNHLVDGNFASLCWWITIPGYNARSTTELQLETQAGQMLDFYVSKKTTGLSP